MDSCYFVAEASLFGLWFGGEEMLWKFLMGGWVGGVGGEREDMKPGFYGNDERCAERMSAVNAGKPSFLTSSNLVDFILFNWELLRWE